MPADPTDKESPIRINPKLREFSIAGTATQYIWELFSDLNNSNASLILKEYCRIRSLKPITFENIQITQEIFMHDSKIESDIELVMSQTNVIKRDACQALIACKGDIVDAIMKLTL
jgi:NACalpha-BTF3-like transcription factor